LVSPLTLGNHVDHRLVRAAAEQAAARKGLALWYYPDYPYAVGPRGDMLGKVGDDWQKTCLSVSPEGLLAWQEAVACYRSQLSTFWKDRAELDAAIASYAQQAGGICMWGKGVI
jgi:LmbE family N-acetylglucosaminyl deacetylase